MPGNDPSQKSPSENEEKFRFLTENISDVIWTVDMGLNYTYFSPSIERLQGYTPAEAIELGVEQTLTPESFERAIQVLNTELEKLEDGPNYARVPIKIELEVLSKDGITIPVEAETNFLFGDDDKPVGIIGVTREITERKKTELALRESEEKFRVVAEQSPNVIFIARKGRVVYQNSRCLDLLGFTVEEICSPDFDFFTLLAPESIATARSSFLKHADGFEVEPVEYTLLRKDGARVYAVINTKLINFESENAVLGIVTDITGRKRAEAKLQRAHDKLEQRVQERTSALEMQKERLEEVNTALNVLLKKRDEDRALIEEKVLMNVKELIEPMIKNLQQSGLNENQMAYVNTLEIFLKDIISPFARNLHTQFLGLTLSEIRVANLIKEGKTTKEISILLNSTPRAIEFHRQNIRKKLGLQNRKVNLAAHL